MAADSTHSPLRLKRQVIVIRDMVPSRLGNSYGVFTTATVTPLPQELDLSHVSVVAEPGLPTLGLVGAGLQPALHVDLLALGQVLVTGLGQLAPSLA